MKRIYIFAAVLMMLFTTACGGNTAYEHTPKSTASPELSEFYEKMQTDRRPVAVMIDNEAAARPQLGLEDAYMVYEIIVEGGATRFMALFNEDDITKLGPVRSSRHYFLDYALEHDAVYVHSGWSPQASRDIRKLGVNNINGIMGTDGGIFWRDRTYDNTWHNLYTGTDKIYDMADTLKGYDIKSDKKHLPYYENDTEPTVTTVAEEVSFSYSDMYSVSYKYDSENKVYKRFINGKEHLSQTDECITAKNIIIYDVINYTLNDGENKGRQDIKNIGSGSGYYITNGVVEEIEWKKETRSGKTAYTRADGTELTLNPGNTFIQIIPSFRGVSYK